MLGHKERGSGHRNVIDMTAATLLVILHIILNIGSLYLKLVANKLVFYGLPIMFNRLISFNLFWHTRPVADLTEPK